MTSVAKKLLCHIRSCIASDEPVTSHDDDVCHALEAASQRGRVMLEQWKFVATEHDASFRKFCPCGVGRADRRVLLRNQLSGSYQVLGLECSHVFDAVPSVRSLLRLAQLLAEHRLRASLLLPQSDDTHPTDGVGLGNATQLPYSTHHPASPQLAKGSVKQRETTLCRNNAPKKYLLDFELNTDTDGDFIRQCKRLVRHGIVEHIDLHQLDSKHNFRLRLEVPALLADRMQQGVMYEMQVKVIQLRIPRRQPVAMRLLFELIDFELAW